MKTNLTSIKEAVDYIEHHLESTLTLDDLSQQTGYSKYHFSRMFVNITGFPVHSYIKRRRLTEAARQLVFTASPVMDIALSAGYETQQSFTTAFRSLFHTSPKAYRKKQTFHPVQLPFTVDGNNQMRGDHMIDIQTVDNPGIRLIGCRKNTRFGFFVIGKCWQDMHAKKHLISNRTDPGFLIGLNDYSKWDAEQEKQPAFDCFAAAQVDAFEHMPKGMEARELPPSRYIVFTFRAKREDSMKPVSDYIYKVWFPQSTCQLNEHALYDFVKYGEQINDDGTSLIEYWVPIL